MNPESFLPPPPPKARQGLAIASLVLGILGIFLSLFLIGGVLGVVGLALGLSHLLSKRGRNAMAWWGVGLSIVSLVITIGLSFVYVSLFKTMKETMASMQTGTGGASEWQGTPAPDITITNLEGKIIQLGELRGKRVVLDFWATWCGPCVKEIPELIRLQNETPKDELVIIGISQENAETLKPFVKKHRVNYAIASATDLPAPFNSIQAIPTTFFIDRKGVIQSVAVGGRDYAQLKELALAKDFEGISQKPPVSPPSGLKEASKMLQANSVWSTNLPGATALCFGDWDGDGITKILVAAGNKLHVLDLDGVEKGGISLPETYSSIVFGRHREKGARILGFSNWGRKVEVVDKAGKQLWSYTSMMGIDGAHWGDLDGDGTDEVIVGMNGFGGLEALSAEGKKIWHVSLGNVWGQAVLSAGSGGQALVFATEAGGTVRVFDGMGRALRTLRPGGAYYTRLAAGIMDQSGQAQLLALGQNLGGSGEQAVAFDSKGQIVWSAPVRAGGSWVQSHFASGQIGGDNNAVWAFIDSSGDLVLATADGEKLAAIPNQSSVGDFMIVPGKNGRGLLVVLRGPTVEAYSFE